MPAACRGLHPLEPPACHHFPTYYASSLFQACSSGHVTDALNCQLGAADTGRRWHVPLTPRNETDGKVIFWPRTFQVMETSQSAAPRHDGTEEDAVERLREILFYYYYYPWRTLSEGCPISSLVVWDLRFVSFLQGVRGVTRVADGNEPGCYRRGHSPDHSPSDRSLIWADSILGEVRGRFHQHSHR